MELEYDNEQNGSSVNDVMLLFGEGKLLCEKFCQVIWLIILHIYERPFSAKLLTRIMVKRGCGVPVVERFVECDALRFRYDGRVIVAHENQGLAEHRVHLV